MRQFNRFVAFLFILVSVAGSSLADNLKAPILEISDTNIIKYDLNVLSFPAGHRMFDAVYDKIIRRHRNAEETVRFMHIGGSHVQAGVFSGRMRDNLQSLNNGKPLGRGLIFPYRMMGSNGARDCDFSYSGTWARSRCTQREPSVPLGLAGAAVTTSDSTSSITLTMPYPVEQLTVLGRSSESAPLIPIVIEEKDTLYPPLYSGLVGFDFLLSKPSKTCRIGFVGQQGGDFSLRGFLCDADGTGFVYSESGINGAAVPSWLKCEKFQEELSLLAPDLVVFAIGINDANCSPSNFNKERFKDNYRHLIASMHSVNPECAFLFVTNNDCYLRVGRKHSFNTNTELVEQAFFELAEEYHGAVWNLFQIMGGMRSSSRWVKAGLMQADHVHFTSRGYQLLGDLLYNAIATDYNLYLSKKN